MYATSLSCMPTHVSVSLFTSGPFVTKQKKTTIRNVLEIKPNDTLALEFAGFLFLYPGSMFSFKNTESMVQRSTPEYTIRPRSVSLVSCPPIPSDATGSSPIELSLPPSQQENGRIAWLQNDEEFELSTGRKLHLWTFHRLMEVDELVWDTLLWVSNQIREMGSSRLSSAQCLWHRLWASLYKTLYGFQRIDRARSQGGRMGDHFERGFIAGVVGREVVNFT